MHRALLASVRHDWATPRHVAGPLVAEFRLTLDVCATPETAVCPRYFTPADDGLAQPWAPARCWLNPPYGRQLPHWIAKADHEAARGALVVALVPSRTDPRWWHDWIWDGARHRPRPGVAVRFLPGRIRFVGAPHAAPFPSAIVIWYPRDARPCGPRDATSHEDGAGREDVTA